jgi:hypothetical protein
MIKLALTLDSSEIPNGADIVFLWDGSATDSFRSQLKPSLESLGPVPALNADFLRVALAVFASDRSVRRNSKGQGWSRELDLSIPVSDPKLWKANAGALVEIMNYLTGDHWALRFTKMPAITIPTSLIADKSERVVLVSGGADSGSGAIYSAHSLAGDETHTLVSHASSTATRMPQVYLHGELEKLFPGKQAAHHQVFIGRKTSFNGTNYTNEPSSRSRSLLFLALGLSVAAQSGAPLWIPENGFASLNPPLGPERIGSLSTRTTQPWFLWRVSEFLQAIGAHGTIVNPFQLMTKGEMFKQVVSVLGAGQASSYLSSTNSCTHTDQHYQGGVSSGTHCGVCFGCILRRSSFKAADVKDQTRYLSDETEFAQYVSKHSIINAAKDFAASGISDATIMAMPLPPTMSAREAKNLCQRGQNEIKDFLK